MRQHISCTGIMSVHHCSRSVIRSQHPAYDGVNTCRSGFQLLTTTNSGPTSSLHDHVPGVTKIRPTPTKIKIIGKDGIYCKIFRDY